MNASLLKLQVCTVDALASEHWQLDISQSASYRHGVYIVVALRLEAEAAQWKEVTASR